MKINNRTLKIIKESVIKKINNFHELKLKFYNKLLIKIKKQQVIII